MSTQQEARPGARERLAVITVVESIGCHFCADAESAIAELASQYAIVVTHIPMSSPQGMDLMQRHGAGMSPLVLLDGQFVSSGRLPRGRIRRMLDSGGFERRVSAP
jgi:glutaredoxin